ncbi:MAG: hypothetical protein GF393_01660, partial [Armatimonadia bacterium]|nr:hypothetical protein [Armatimonadia bacterium]
DFSVEQATVRPDGRINVPVAGDVTVAGRTVEEVAAEVAEALGKELRDPQVSVRLVRRHVEPIYVLGAVRSPGAIEVREPVTVAQAIALAQGLSATAAPRWATLIDADGRERRIDVVTALRGAEAEARRIAPGETLLVSAQYLVTVVGQVAEPGRYPAEDGDRVGDALAAAGGLTDNAAQAGTLLRVDGAQVELDLEALIERGEAQANLALAAGDTIVVPPARRRVALVGAFAEPGKYDFDPGDRVSDALALARDVADDALPGSALLMRADGTSQRLDLEALLQASEGAEDPELRDGDTLVLPRGTERVAVVGMVAKPGQLPLEPAMTVMDAIAAAGGWEQEAHPEKSFLWRQTDGGPEMTRVNAERLMRGAEGEANPALAPGDIIYVPRDPSMTRDELSRLLLGVSGLLRIAF